MLHESGSEDPALYELYSHSNGCLVANFRIWNPRRKVLEKWNGDRHFRLSRRGVG